MADKQSGSPGTTGSEISITDALQGYFAAPRLRSGRRMGIVVVAEAGEADGRRAADHLAFHGFEALQLDLRADPAPPDESSEQEWLSDLLPEVEAAVAFLRQKGCARFGGLGFGRGGRVAEAATRLGHFAAAVSVHGTGHSARTFAEANGRLLYVTSANDPAAAVLSDLAAVGAEVKALQDNGVTDELLDLVVDTFSKACLRKATFVKVGTLHPDAKGVNVLLKVLEEPKEVPTAAGKVFEARCGDETAQVVLSLQEAQLSGIRPDKVLAARNASIHMVQGFMRLAVDKWGKLDLAASEQIGEIGPKNLSDIEYELMRP